MDPFSIAALISAGGGALSSIFGGISESQNTKAANKLAAQATADQKLGAIDARGNRTRFVDGQGWVTTYGPTDKALEQYFLNTELPALQDQFRRADLASRNEDVTANSLLQEFNRIQKGNTSDVENLLFTAGSRGVNEGADKALEVAMRSALRSGSSNAGNIAREINTGRLNALKDVGVDSKLQALDYVTNSYANERNNVANLYNAFADQARSSLSATTSAGSTPTSSVVGSQSYTPPQADNGLANALGGIATSVSGGLNSYSANQQNAQTNQLLQAFLSNGGGSGVSSYVASANERAKRPALGGSNF